MNIQPRIFGALILLLVVAVPNPSWAVNSPPTSDPNGPYSGTVGSPLTFDGSGSSDPDGTLVAYDWDFGDGSTGTGVSPTHTYASNGTFTVALTVTDDAGVTETATTTANIAAVSNQPPVSDPNGPYSGTVGIPLTFDGSGSFDPDGTLVAYDWDFGDGSTGTGVSPTHTYASNGTFTVALTVTDEAGVTETATTTASIGLGNQPPECDAASPSMMLAWPANRKFVDVSVLGVTDPDGDPIAIEIIDISQDELVDEIGNGRFVPDGMGIGTSTAVVRAERLGGGNGRVYHIVFNATDYNGAECTGEVMVSVPANQSGAPAVDDGPFYDSTATP